MTAANEALSTNKPAVVTFDTLIAAQQLRNSGFDDRQAEAIVTTINTAMNETVATKADLELQGTATRKDLEVQTAEIRAEIAVTRSEIAVTRKELEAQIAVTRKDLEAQMAVIRADIGALKQTMASVQDKIVIRLGALMVSMTFLLLAVGPFYIRWVMSLMAS
ncbi:MAG: hypothetical protein OXD47_10275 [Gammaproteobacteria bacterium]|nr:hypothetical protein [Gammaproteobacteria bacterium]MCY4339169.1 hypothetical protein [Gammaproteobacteria bacterium]